MTAVNFTIRKKDNGYQLIASYKVGRKWKQKSKQGFRTKLDAKAYQKELLDDLERDNGLTSDKRLLNITFIAFFQEYVLDRESLSYNTKRLYKMAIDRLKSVPTLPIKEITFSDVMQEIKKLENREISVSTINLTIVIIKMVLNLAVSYGIVRENVAGQIKQLKDKRAEKRLALNDEQYEKILANIDPTETKTQLVIYIACKTGMRFGEILGLTWDCFDEINRSLTINKQYTAVGFAPVKNKYGNRVIPIPCELSNVLSAIKRHQKVIPIDNRIVDLVYCSSSCNRKIKSIIGEKYSLHSLRHTYATRLLANGADIKTVASLLGDTVGTVINNYVHETDEMRRNASILIEQIM